MKKICNHCGSPINDYVPWRIDHRYGHTVLVHKVCADFEARYEDLAATVLLEKDNEGV